MLPLFKAYTLFVCSKIGHAGGNGVKNEDHLSYATGGKGTQCLQPKSNSFNYETE